MSKRPRMILSPNGNQPPPAMQIAAPFNDYQIVALMAAILMGPPDIDPGAPPDVQLRLRNEDASAAVTRALDILGHAAYRLGNGSISATIGRAVEKGASDAREAIEAEEARARGETTEPAPKLLDEHGDPQGAA